TRLYGPEFGTRGKQQGGEPLAYQLLGARVGIGIEIRNQPVSPHQWKRGYGSLHGAQLGIHVAFHGNGGVGAVETAQSELRPISDGRSHADAFLNASLGLASNRSEL